MKRYGYIVMTVACAALSANTYASADTDAGRLVSVAKEDMDKYIVLSEYKGLDLTEKIQTVAVRESEAAVEGDTVVFDYVGKIPTGSDEDGNAPKTKEETEVENNKTEFEEISAQDVKLVLGMGDDVLGITEFEECLTGMSAGESVNADVILPEDYINESDAGKKAEFTLTVKQVRRVPELTDEWVAENTEQTTIYELLEAAASEEVSEDTKIDAWYQVLESSELLDVEDLLDEEAEKQFTLIEASIGEIGTTLDELYKEYGCANREEFLEIIKEDVDITLKESLVIQAIMDAENVTVQSPEIQNEIQKLADIYTAGDKEKLYEYFIEDTVISEAVLNWVQQLIVDHAEITVDFDESLYGESEEENDIYEVDQSYVYEDDFVLGSIETEDGDIIDLVDGEEIHYAGDNLDGIEDAEVIE